MSAVRAFCAIRTITPDADSGQDLSGSSGVVEVQLADQPQLLTSYLEALELVGSNLAPVAFAAPEMETMEGLPLREPKTPQMLFRIRLPKKAPALSILRHRVEAEQNGPAAPEA